MSEKVDPCELDFQEYLQNMNGAPLTFRDMFRAAWHHQQQRMGLERLGGRLEGRLEAFAMAMTECSASFQRDVPDVRVAIDILHLDTLRQIKELKNGS